MSLYTAEYAATQRGITALIKKEMDKHKSIYPLISDVRPTTSKDEEFMIAGNSAGVRKWVGDREFKRLSAATVTIAPDPWESSVMLDRFNYEDDRLGVYSNVLGDLADEAAAHPDELMAEFLVKGETAQCWDGQYFFDTDHAWRDSGSQDNIVSYNVADTANPTPIEMRAAFETATRRIKSFKKDNGKRYYRAAAEHLSDFVAFTPMALQNPLNRAFDQVQISDGTTGVSNVPYERPNVVPVNLINSDDSWDGVAGSDTDFYVFYTGSRWKPLIFQPRSNIRTQIKGLTGEDIEHKDIKVMTEGRYNFGYFAWMYAIKVKLT